MPIEITMPRLSDTMEEGSLVKWRVQVGDRVTAGDLLADIETDKATMELQSFDDGVVARLVADEGQTLPVGELIAVLAGEGESVGDAVNGLDSAPAATVATMPDSTPSHIVSPEAVEITPPHNGDRIRISPVARKIAEQRGIDPAALTGTGPSGRIIKRDVLAAGDAGLAPPLVKPVPTAVEAKSIPLTNMRMTIARRLVESKTTIPHFTVTVAVDMDPLLRVRQDMNKQLAAESVKLSVNDFIVRACAMALHDHPVCNSSWEQDVIRQPGTINIGIAVAISHAKGGGLVVPTLRDAQSKSLRQINAQIRALVAKARDTGLTVEEMSDGTFTLSNLGMLGVDHFEAIINPPQSAILAVGAALEKPVVRDGRIVVGREMTCTLSCDHRVIDGAEAAKFLQTLRSLLEHPAAMLV